MNFPSLLQDEDTKEQVSLHILMQHRLGSPILMVQRVCQRYSVLDQKVVG